MAPIHSRMEKPPKSWRQNFTHSGVVGGGVRALGPSRARISWALLWVRPCGGGGWGQGDTEGHRGSHRMHGDLWGGVGICGDLWGGMGIYGEALGCMGTQREP